MAPGMLESSDAGLQPYTLSGLKTEEETLFAQAIPDYQNGVIDQDEFFRVYLKMKKHKDNYNMALGAHMLTEANTYKTTVYQPAYDAWETAKVNYDADDSDANRDSLLAAEAGLAETEAGLNDRSSYLDILRDFSFFSEFGG